MLLYCSCVLNVEIRCLSVQAPTAGFWGMLTGPKCTMGTDPTAGSSCTAPAHDSAWLPQCKLSPAPQATNKAVWCGGSDYQTYSRLGVPRTARRHDRRPQRSASSQPSPALHPRKQREILRTHPPLPLCARCMQYRAICVATMPCAATVVGTVVHSSVGSGVLECPARSRVRGGGAHELMRRRPARGSYTSNQSDYLSMIRRDAAGGQG